VNIRHSNTSKPKRTSLSDDVYGKWLELEKLVAKIFSVKGYFVKHNVKLTGRSGVKHQIDIYAEYRAPLHTSRIIIECKAYDEPVSKDTVMKLIQEVEDLGADKGILITTSYFTPDAVSTAKGHNIDLWNGVKLRELLSEIKIEETEKISTPKNIFYVKPAVSIQKAIEVVDDMLTGFLGHKKGLIEASTIIFYPFYELDVINAKIHETKGFLIKTTEEKIVDITILIDAVTGALCSYTVPQSAFTKQITRVMHLPTLTDEEKRALKIILHTEYITTSALSSLMACSTAKARKILQGLAIKGVLTMIRRGLYRLEIKLPDPTLLKPVSHNLKLETNKPSKGHTIKQVLNINEVKETVKLLFEGQIKDYRLIYYPYYTCKINEEEKRYIIAVDMQNNAIDKETGKILTTLYPHLPTFT